MTRLESVLRRLWLVVCVGFCALIALLVMGNSIGVIKTDPWQLVGNIWN